MITRFILFSLLTLSTAFAQDSPEILVQAQVSAKSFYMGQPFSLTILVDGSNKVKPPLISDIPGFSIKKTEERALKSKDKAGFVIRYDLIPREKGSFSIPEILIDVNGKEYLTKEIKIEVKQPAENPALKLSILVSQNEVYVGEPLLLTFVWESEVPLYTLKAVDVNFPVLKDSAFRSIPPFNAAEGGSKDTIGLPVSDVRMICSHEILMRNEKRIEVLKFKRVILPRYAGEFDIKQAILLCSFIPPEEKSKNKRFQNTKNWKPNYPSYFNNDFFEKEGDVVFEKFIAKSNSIKIKVKDLPVDGRPDDFYGIVGKCEVSATATPVILEAGAPLHLSIKISDYDFPATLKMPNFSKLRTYNRNFSIPQQKSSGEYDGADKLYTQTLRPLRTDVTEIPPVRIPYFDPQTGTYNIAQSKAISITVKPAGKVTAFDAELSSEANLKNRLLNSPQGIRHNNLNIETMNKVSVKPISLVLYALFIPIILFSLFVMISANHRLKLKEPKKFISLKAYSTFSRSSSINITQLELNVRKYFADKLGITADAHTASDLISKINDLSDSEENQLKELYNAFNFDRFNKDNISPSIDKLQTTASSLIKNIDGRLKYV